VLKVALAGALVLAAVLGIGRFAYSPLLPPMQDALGWSVAQAGDVASANYLGYVLGALAASALAQRTGRRFWLFAGMIFSGVTTLAGALVTSFPAWLMIRFGSGVASAFCFVLGTALVLEFLARHARPQLGALHFSGIGGGIVLSVLVIEVSRQQGISIFGQWGALGSFAILLLAGAWWVIRTLPRKPVKEARPAAYLAQGPVPGAAQAPASASHLLNRLIIAYGLFGFGYVVTATFIVAMARRLEQAAYLEPLTWIIVGVTAAPSIFVWQWVARRLGIYTALRVAYVIEAAGVLLAGFAAGQVAVVTGGALLGGTFVGIVALGVGAARRAAGINQDRAVGWMTASFGLGQLLGPAVAGRLAQMTGSFAAPSLVAALLLLLGIALLWGVEEQ
jgi:predicted MFS family arabinose efflux permease